MPQFDVAQFNTEAEFRVPQFAWTTLKLVLNIGGDHTSYRFRVRIGIKVELLVGANCKDVNAIMLSLNARKS